MDRPERGFAWLALIGQQLARPDGRLCLDHAGEPRRLPTSPVPLVPAQRGDNVHRGPEHDPDLGR
jgi:hypothetical protein